VSVRGIEDIGRVITAEESGQFVDMAELFNPTNSSEESRALLDQNRDAVNQGLAVPIVLRSVLLQESISCLDRLQKLSRGGITYGSDLEVAASSLRAKFRQSFYQATGSKALEAAAGSKSLPGEARNYVMEPNFTRLYHTRDKQGKARAEFRAKLVASFRTQQLDRQTAHNRVHGLRPHRTRILSKEEGLDTHDRLIAILEDPRAGFITPTNREKNMTLALLDFLDNPEYPFRINNSHIAIYNFLEKQRRRPKNVDLDSRRGPESVTYEITDFLRNALASRKALQALQIDLNECLNPTVTVGEETDYIDPDHPGLPALIRYLDLKHFIANGVSKVFDKDPLRTKVHPLPHTGDGPHKIIGDSYTSSRLKPAGQALITRATSSLNIGLARKEIANAIVDQTLRESFMHHILCLIAEAPTSGSRLLPLILQPARDAALQALAEYKTALG
jgi:hypothetical protein